MANKGETAVLAKILNKTGFVAELKSAGKTSEEIDTEWQKIEKIFSLFYFQEAYQALPRDEQDKVSQGFSKTPDSGDIETLSNRISEILRDKPTLVDQKEIIKKAASATLAEYVKFKKGGN